MFYCTTDVLSDYEQMDVFLIFCLIYVFDIKGNRAQLKTQL